MVEPRRIVSISLISRGTIKREGMKRGREGRGIGKGENRKRGWEKGNKSGYVQKIKRRVEKEGRRRTRDWERERVKGRIEEVVKAEEKGKNKGMY